MGISDRLLGKKNVNGHPHIEAVHPSAALPGGEVRIIGSSLRPQELRRPVQGAWPEVLEPLSDTYVDQTFKGPLG